MTFSETVKVEGTPRVSLRVGSRNRPAGYLSGTDTVALEFSYEVADGDEDTGGVSINAGRISLNGGTIKDEAENAADLAHEALATQAGHQVDGVRPAFVSAAVDGSSLTLTYGEALDGGSRPASGDFEVTVDGSARTVSGVSISGSVVTLTLNPAVEHGDTGNSGELHTRDRPNRGRGGQRGPGVEQPVGDQHHGGDKYGPGDYHPGSVDCPREPGVGEAAGRQGHRRGGRGDGLGDCGRGRPGAVLD